MILWGQIVVPHLFPTDDFYTTLRGMSKSFETNQETHTRDFGRIVLYQRADRKSGTYYARIAIDGSKGYRKVSTGKTDPQDALREADLKYRELLVLQDRMGDIHHKPFLQVMREWETYERRSGSNNKKKIDDYIEKLERYAVPFFRKFAGVAEVKETHLKDWVGYRRTNYLRSPPADNTIVRELAGIKQVFEYAYARDYIPTRLKLPKVSVRPNPRPAFTDAEYKKLYTRMRMWVKSVKDHPHHYRSRFYIQHFILVAANSGLRKGELRNLCWGDIGRRTDGEGILIYVSKESKRKQARQVVPQEDTEIYFDRLKKFRCKELGLEKPEDVPDNEPVFCSADGKPVGDYKKGFASCLKYCELETDRDGNPFTIYSLRHTYATFRLNNRAPLYFVANNMGTSPEMVIKYYSHLINDAVAKDITQVVKRGS